MFVSGRRGAVITTLLQDTPHTHMPAAARQPPHRSWIELSATLDFMLATLVGNGAAWSVPTLPAIKLNSHPYIVAKVATRAAARYSVVSARTLGWSFVNSRITECRIISPSDTRPNINET
jgi:hypothetical protein